MRKKAVTIYDIAQRLNISPSTVSRGLRNDERINIDTRRLIAATAKELNYHPNRVAAGLRGGTTSTIGVIVPRIGRTFFANAISGIESVARSRNCQVIITQSNETLATEIENVQALTAARVDGIIASISVETDVTDHFQLLQEQQFPLVFFDRVGRGFPAHRVMLDDFDSAVHAVTHLIEGGARRIAHLGGPSCLNVYENRYRGYLEALTTAGLPVYDEFVVLDAVNEKRAMEEAERMFALPEVPDAIFCASDYGALGVTKYAELHGISIPEDLRLVSFANEPFTSIMTPTLSSVDQFSERMGITAAEMLFRQIDATEKPSEFEEIIVPGKLLVRQSSLVGSTKHSNKVLP